MTFLETFVLIAGFICLPIFGYTVHLSIKLVKEWRTIEHDIKFAFKIMGPYFIMGLLSAIVGTTALFRSISLSFVGHGFLLVIIVIVVFFIYMGVLLRLDRVVRGFSEDSGWVSKAIAVIIFLYLLGSSGFGIFGIIWYFIIGYVDIEFMTLGYVGSVFAVIGLHIIIIELRMTIWKIRNRY